MFNLSITDSCFRNLSQADRQVVDSTIERIYSLKSNVENPLLLNIFSRSALVVLICLMKYCSIFGEDVKLKVIEDLMKNEDAIFLGSLFIKFCGIKNTNCHEVRYSESII